jgi:TRAP-type transport system periplasmic protein
MKRFSNSWIAILMGVFLYSALFLISPLYTYGQEVIQLKAANIHPVGHRLTKDAYELWANEINKRTHGKVKITWFPGGTLAKADQSYDAMIGGLTDISIICVFAVPQVFPLNDLMEYPFLVDNSIHESDVAWEMYQTIPEFKQELAKMKVLGFFSTDVVNLAMTKPPLVKKMNDLKGRQVISASPRGVEMMRVLGATPQFQKLEDVYLSLQRGMAEGLTFPIAPLRSFKIVELCRYYTILNLSVSPYIVAMNMDTWKKLPPDVQKVFEETGPSFSRLAAHTLTNEGLWVLEELKKRGDEIYVLSQQERVEWRKATKPMYDNWVQKVNGMGLNGQALLDKVFAISEKKRKSPSGIDEWWKQGRMGKKIN